MGWNISHGLNTRSGTLYRSASAMGDVGRHVANCLSGSDWRVVRPLFEAAQRSEPFTVHAEQAAQIGRLLHKAANDPRMPNRDSSNDLCCSAWVHELADAAEYAANSGQLWSWR